MPRISRLLGAALLSLVACVGPPAPTERTAAGDPAEAHSRIAAELERLGFGPVSGTGGTLVASRSGVPAGWASCPPELVTQDDPERRMVTADSRSGTVRVALEPARGGTHVRVATEFAGSYRNPLTTYRFERPCRSTGEVETRLLAAAGGPAARAGAQQPPGGRGGGEAARVAPILRRYVGIG